MFLGTFLENTRCKLRRIASTRNEQFGDFQCIAIISFFLLKNTRIIVILPQENRGVF